MQGIYEEIQMRKSPIVVVGLGYVGLPLATLFASKFSVVGLDINSKRVEELKSGHDRTKEVEDRARLINPNISYTTNPDIIKQSKLVIVTVPTPVDEYKKPDLCFRGHWKAYS